MVKQLVERTSALWAVASAVQLNCTWSKTLQNTSSSKLVFTVVEIATD